MAALHAALKSLAPCKFSDIPTGPDELDNYLTNLYHDCQTILESVPISDPSDASHTRPRSQTSSSVASSASEMSASTARSAPPAPEIAELKKEWGKAIKLSAKENPLGVSVYKASGKDSRGAWFARRSVHEGLGFARFKKGLQREFPESMETRGHAPGEGNIRGIGGEKKVEDIGVKGRGRLQVWQLSAQFPGPTTPRDFITLLVTSSKAMQEPHHELEITPRHYMIISKPCDHPDTQPRSGYIRGQYESVEFIREVPRKPNSSLSTFDTQGNGRTPPSLEQQMFKQKREKTHTFPMQQQNRSTDEVPEHGHLHSRTASQDRETSPGRKRASTVATSHDHHEEHYDPEENPVEWIMITRSDPGGSVPRFMVERGTPSSIVADASKFLDWACQKDEPEDGEPPTPSSEVPPPPRPQRRESFASWQANGTLAGIKEPDEEPGQQQQTEAFPNMSEPASPVDGRDSPTSTRSELGAAQSGFMASATGALSSVLDNYAPQAVLDHLPAGTSTPRAVAASSPALLSGHKKEDSNVSNATTLPSGDNDDASSTISSLSFASADSHLRSEEGDSKDPSILSASSPGKEARDKNDPTEKEHASFRKRTMTLDKKLEATKQKYTKDAEGQNDKVRKAEEKHKKELEKEEERYKKNLAKIEEKKKRELRKEDEKKRKEADKDEKTKLTRERDEAIEKWKLLEKQVELLTGQVGHLQKENTVLMARIGRFEDGSTPVKKLVHKESHERARSRSSSLKRLKMVSGEGSSGS